MEIKKTIKILGTMLLCIGITACTSDETTEAKPGSELLIAEKDVVIPCSATSWVLGVTADCQWEVSAIDNPAWGELTISPRSGDGNGVLVLTTIPNRYSVERTAALTLTSKGGLKQTMTIRQAKSDAALSINQDEFMFGDAEEVQNLVISSNSDWEILGASNLDWLEFGQTTGRSGSTEVPIRVKDAFDDVNRIATITVIAGSQGTNQIAFPVTQLGKSSISLAVGTSEIPDLPAAGGSQTVNVSCNAGWYAYVPANAQRWLHVEPAIGFGNSELRISCDPNTNTESGRNSMVIIVSGSRLPQQCDILVSQLASEPQTKPEEPDNQDPQLSR